MTDVPEPRCARCGCTSAEHHKLHCEGRGGNCICAGGWLDPGHQLTAVDEAFQAENAEYDDAKARADLEQAIIDRQKVRIEQLLVTVGQLRAGQGEDGARRIRDLERDLRERTTERDHARNERDWMQAGIHAALPDATHTMLPRTPSDPQRPARAAGDWYRRASEYWDQMVEARHERDQLQARIDAALTVVDTQPWRAPTTVDAIQAALKGHTGPHEADRG